MGVGGKVGFSAVARQRRSNRTKKHYFYLLDSAASMLADKEKSRDQFFILLESGFAKKIYLNAESTIPL